MAGLHSVREVRSMLGAPPLPNTTTATARHTTAGRQATTFGIPSKVLPIGAILFSYDHLNERASDHHGVVGIKPPRNTAVIEELPLDTCRDSPALYVLGMLHTPHQETRRRLKLGRSRTQ